MMRSFFSYTRRPVAERLLDLRSRAGADPCKHDHYHRLVNRYQRKMLKRYIWQKRFPFLRWFFQLS